MKHRVLRKVALIIGGIAGLIALGWIALWLANGGWPASGPTGDVLPPHIYRVSPKDGEVVTETRGFCIEFHFQEGNGMGYAPIQSVRFFLDGINVTKRVNGLLTLDYPPSGGSLCYTADIPLSSGWHTVKVTYNDSINQKFEYTWRFQITSAE